VDAGRTPKRPKGLQGPSFSFGSMFAIPTV
jgi:hypothetical protein